LKVGTYLFGRYLPFSEFQDFEINEKVFRTKDKGENYSNLIKTRTRGDSLNYLHSTWVNTSTWVGTR
jgi:hypothetical protein